MSESHEDDALIMRLRDLALVDLDALLAGAEGEAYTQLLVTHAEDLEDALRSARARAGELTKTIVGADPLVLLDSGYAVRARALRSASSRSSACVTRSCVYASPSAPARSASRSTSARSRRRMM
ncbi:MAG: hypothetical protein K8M05_38625, partial [Deltaproteobacteria bacterium]|nr:hypothetical protein [Kofleriaceae bacterium]